MTTTTSGRLTVKRIVETIVVALPVLLVALGLASGKIGVIVDFVSILWLLGVLALAAAVFTQHWAGYIFLLIVGIAALFTSGLLALVLWIIGGIYIAIAVFNLIVILTNSRRALTARTRQRMPTG